MKKLGVVFLWIGIAEQVARAIGLPADMWKPHMQQSWTETVRQSIRREEETGTTKRKPSKSVRVWN